MTQESLPPRITGPIGKAEPPQKSLHPPLNITTQDISRARVFEEPLVPMGTDPTPTENAALAAALHGYARRAGPDDFFSLTGFLADYPHSAWNAALLTNLGLEYYTAGHYSRALDAWTKASQFAKAASDLTGQALADRAVGELALMHARLGHMTELDALLKSLEGRTFSGPATERITGAREALSNMKTRPEIAFRCGPFALYQIKLLVDPLSPKTDLIHASESTRLGFSLSQVAALSSRLGLYFQMAYREKGAAFVLPSVVHFRLDHYAAMVRQEGDHYLLQDPTFENDVWMTREALEGEASGYFLVPPGELPRGWRGVSAREADSVWGKGLTGENDKGPHAPCDPSTQGGSSCSKPDPDCKGIAVPRVHLMLVSLNINDEPVGYSPPVGAAMRFMVRYNQRDAFQPSNFLYSNLGPKWTFDWLSYITDKPITSSADVSYYVMGGGTRVFTGFVAADPSKGIPFDNYAFQQLDQTKLIRTSPDSYEMLYSDGARKVFAEVWTGSIPSKDTSPTLETSPWGGGVVSLSRKIFLTQLIDPSGNSVSLSYDAHVRVAKITDAIGQVTSLSYDHPTDMFKITKVTDPFGRFATFDYDASNRLSRITDVIGLTSEFTYEADGPSGSTSDFIVKLETKTKTAGLPSRVTTFAKTEPGNTRSLETTYPNGDKDRVEYNQSTTLPGIHALDPVQSVPGGVTTGNHFGFLFYRNTYYWSKVAYAAAYPDPTAASPDYTKAKVFHWLHGLAHAPNMNTTAGVLESVKEPLEGRVWYDYAGQSSGPLVVGSTNKPAHVGRVLADGFTQLYTYEYNGFGHLIKQVDPVGRTFSYLYAPNGIDLLETRQTRAGRNELLSKATYNTKHLPLTSTDAAGQTTTYTYNTRGQMVTKTNAKNETITHSYDVNGHLKSVNGPLPGAATTFTYDSVGRVRTKTDESGYTLTFDYDALDRLTKLTFPDGTFDQHSYERLDLILIRDRAGRETTFEYNSIRQMTKRTDPLNRMTLFQWCRCGALKSLTDSMGRSTTWRHDIQGRVTSKEYADGSKLTYRYDNTITRLSQRIDEQLQVTQYDYNRDDTLARISYSNALVATPPVALEYDSAYRRLRSMTDGTGTTRFRYVPINAVLSLGSGQLASVDGPLPNDTMTFAYDALGRRVSTGVNGVASSVTYDAGGRITSDTNALGVFNNTHDGTSPRNASQSYPNGQTVQFTYAGNLLDQHLQRITNKLGSTLLSEFTYVRNVPTGQIASWSQQAGTQTPTVHSLAYDLADQLIADSVSAASVVTSTYSYSYDPASNRLTEQVDATTRQFSYNALNELTSVEGDASPDASYRWDAEHRLVSVTSGNQNTEFTYDGLGRRVGIRLLVSGTEVSHRRFVWCDAEISEERTAAGIVSKRFFAQGMTVETGGMAGHYFYSRDHLGSIREMTDSSGNVRARYSYDPFGRRTLLTGDIDADFGFAGMFWANESRLSLTWFRAYDPHLGRWLSRDPVRDAEAGQGPNLYAYARNNPGNRVDPLGLTCCEPEYLRMIGALRSLEIAEAILAKLRFGGVAVFAATCIKLGELACAAAGATLYATLVNAVAGVETAEANFEVAAAIYERCLMTTPSCAEEGCALDRY